MIWVAGILIATSAYAQTDVSTGIMRGKDYGVTYLLPKTEIEIVVQATKHTYMPGEFCKYADRYLRMNNVSADPNIYWTIDKVQTHVAGVPDKDNVYFVKLKDKTVAPLMELTEDGIVRSINIPLNSHTIPATKITAAAQEIIDPRKFLTEEILMASSRAKMAELVAKEIYNIRESKMPFSVVKPTICRRMAPNSNHARQPQLTGTCYDGDVLRNLERRTSDVYNPPDSQRNEQ